MFLARKHAKTAVVAAAVVGMLAPAGAAMATPAVPAASASASSAASTASSGVKVDVASAYLSSVDDLVEIIVYEVEHAQNRSGYVKSIREASWYGTNQKHNVMVINKDLDYSTKNMKNVVFDGTVSGSDYPEFRVLIFDSGVITNKGDGGYINWAYRGWFDKKNDGYTVDFDHKP